MRCPACGGLGYPDRAKQNLITLSWTCASCGTANDGQYNFCLECGAGLASRCLRCEAPVYSAICLKCGTHQARAERFEAEQRYRRDSTEPRPLTPQEQAARASVERPSGWRELDMRWRRAVRLRARRWRGRQLAWLVWLGLLMLMVLVWMLGGLWPMVLWGAGTLLWGVLPGRVRRTLAGLLVAAAAIWVGLIQAGTIMRSIQPLIDQVKNLIIQFERDVEPLIINWWQAFTATLPEALELQPEDWRYAALFGTIAFSLAALPIGIYLIDRFARRLFRD
jgi:hypothetical protein